MTKFQSVALAALVSVFVLIFVGAIVRVTGAGLGCPDWPTCWGCLIPPWKKEQVDFSTDRFREDSGPRRSGLGATRSRSPRNRSCGQFQPGAHLDRVCEPPVHAAGRPVHAGHLHRAIASRSGSGGRGGGGGLRGAGAWCCVNAWLGAQDRLQRTEAGGDHACTWRLAMLLMVPAGIHRLAGLRAALAAAVSAGLATGPGW